MLKEDLALECARLFNIHPRDLLGTYRFRFIVRARQALYLALRRRGWSYPAIGRFLSRDHSSVIYGTKMALHLSQRDPEYAAKIERLTDYEYADEEGLQAALTADSKDVSATETTP
jgi:chromosomal replication initiation ATPase DnaA